MASPSPGTSLSTWATCPTARVPDEAEGQSAPPAAVMLAGSGVPIVALTWGWPSAYVIAGIMALTVVGAVRRRHPTAKIATPSPEAATSGGDPPPSPRPSTVVIRSVAFGLARTRPA